MLGQWFDKFLCKLLILRRRVFKMFTVGPYPVRTNTESLTLRRRGPAVADVSVTVPLEGVGGWRLLSVAGRVLSIGGRSLGVRFDPSAITFAESGCLAVAGRVIQIGDRCIGFVSPAGELPVKGDPATVAIGDRRVSGVLTDWGYAIQGESVATWTGRIVDGSYRFQAIVRPSTAGAWGVVSGGEDTRARLARAVGDLVGLVVEGEDQLKGLLDVEPRIGERWLSVWRRVLLDTAWRVEGVRVVIGDFAVRRVFIDGHYTVEPLETGRAATVAVHEGVVVGVVGEGLPEEVVDVQTVDQLAAVHETLSLRAVRVTVSGVDTGDDVRVGDYVRLALPGVFGFRQYVVDTWSVEADETSLPALTVTLLPVGAGEDRVYG